MIVSNFWILLVALLCNVMSHPLVSQDGDEMTAAEVIGSENKDYEDMYPLMEGDMFMPQSAAVVKTQGQWPNGVVPYTMNGDFNDNDKKKIRDALQLIVDAAPCLSFPEYAFRSSNVPTAHVEIGKRGGCWSMVGRQGRMQQMSLSNGCLSSGTIIHEFLHAIGFFHEQSRPDRDTYVNIYLNNVQGGMEHNFRKHNNIDSLGVGYDRVSVMHYSAWAFSKNGQKTITWKDDETLPLGGWRLSAKDKLQINLKYCNGPKPTTTSTTTTTKRTRPTTERTTRPTTTTTTTTTTTERTPPPTTKRPTRPTTEKTRPTTRSTTTKIMSTTEPTRPTPPKTTKMPTQACGDKVGWCIRVQFFLLQGHKCSWYTKKYCPRSCGVCQGPESDKCLNLADKQRSCEQRAMHGECQHKDSRIRWNMKMACPRTCCDRDELYKLPKKH